MGNLTKTQSETALFNFLREHNFRYVDKRNKKRGCLWVVCTEEQTNGLNLLFADLDFFFVFTPNGGKAVGYVPSCYSKPKYGKTVHTSIVNSIHNYGNDEDALLAFLSDNKIEYIDKRSIGSLWILCDSQTTSAINLKFVDTDYSFVYTPNGGKATNHRPGCYSKAKNTTNTAVQQPVLAPQNQPLPVQPAPQVLPAPHSKPVAQPTPPPPPIEIPTPPSNSAPVKTGGSGCLVACVAMIAVISLICLI